MAVGQRKQTDPPSLPVLYFQREHLGPWPSWMPCTKLWLAVSSCRKNHRCQPLQVLHSPTPFSFPAEVAGPACGHPGQPGHHQTSL